MKPFFTTNDSDIPQLEGLYIKEILPPATVTGANLNKVCMVGEAIRGPVDQAIDITSEQRFVEVFGGRDQGSGGNTISPMYKALMNKPFGTITCVRAAAAGAAKAVGTLTGGLAATGSIQDVAKASHVDAETTTISDGVLSKVYEYDVAGDGVTAGHIAVNVSGAVTAADCGAALAAAINASGQAITAQHVGGGLVQLVNDNIGTAGNVAITTTVASGSYTHTGMSGGTASGSNIATISATSVGAWGNLVGWKTQAATDGNPDHFNLVISYLAGGATYQNIDMSEGNDTSAQVLGDDAGNIVVLTKLANGVPSSTGSGTLSGGSDGSIADSDFTASGRGLNVAAAAPGVAVVFIAERMSAALKAEVATLAAGSSDRMWLIGADSETVSAATAITDVASYRSDRIVYVYNHVYTLDGATATQVLSRPESWLASVLSQTDVDIHPSDVANLQYTAGAMSLYNQTYQRGDYIAFRAAGIAAYQNDQGISLVSGVTTSLTSGLEEITRRRMTDYLQISIANALKSSVYKKNTQTRRLANAGMVNAFLADLENQERIVQAYNVDIDKLNTPTQRAQGIEKMLISVQLIGHILELVLETEIGTSVVISQQ